MASHNLHRRHLTGPQREAIAAEMATMKVGANQFTEGRSIDRPSVSETQAAEIMKVSVAQVRRARPDLDVRGIRGNVDTRLRKVDEGEYDAVVLAEAGLERIGRTDRIGEAFDEGRWPTSAGQGALAVEVRDGDPFAPALAALTDPDAEATALLERAVLRRLEAGCAAPVGLTARVADGGAVFLVAEVYALDGARSVRVERSFARAEVLGGDDPGTEALGDEARDAAAADVVAELLDRGAGDLADLAGSGR